MNRRCASALRILTILFFVAGCSPDVLDVNPTVVKTLSGRVVQSSRAGRGIANATVECMGRTTVTDSAGRFTLHDVPMDATRTILRVYADKHPSITQAFVPTDSAVANYLVVAPNFVSTLSNTSPIGYVFSRGGRRVVLPLDAFVTRSGAPYTGKVFGYSTSYSVGSNSDWNVRLGDHSAQFANGSRGVLERTTAVRYVFLGSDNDTVFVRSGTACTLEQSVDAAPEFEESMSIYTFDHSSAYWKVAGTATLDSTTYRGTFVWSNDVTMNYLRATRRPATIRVVGPDARPIRWCTVSLSGKSELTDSLGVCNLRLTRSSGTLVEVRDATNTVTLATYSMEGVSEADPGEHTIVLSTMPTILRGTYSYCDNSRTDAHIVLSRQGGSFTFFARASPFAVPIPPNPNFDVYAHNNASVTSAVVKVTPANVVGGVVNVGNLSICTSYLEDQSLIPLPAGSVVVSAACQRASGGVYVVTTKSILTYNSKRELVASVPLSASVGTQDTMLWTAYVSSNDRYIYVTNSRRIVDAIEISTGRVVFHQEFGGSATRATAIGVDPELAQTVFAYIQNSQVHVSTHNSHDGQQILRDSVHVKDIARPFGVEGATLYMGRYVSLRLMHLEAVSIACLDLSRKPVVEKWDYAFFGGLSKGGSLAAFTPEDGGKTLYNVATKRSVPFPAGHSEYSFFTSPNDQHLGSVQGGRIVISDAATGMQTLTKQILPPSMGWSLVDLSDNGRQLCVIVGTRATAKVLAVPLD